MVDVIRRITRQELESEAPRELLRREWLVTNGLGGYASGTILGVATRRYHGLLIAGLPGPLGRRMLLSHLSERLRRVDGSTVQLSGHLGSPDDLHGTHIAEFRLEMGMPVWVYEVGELVIEKRIVMTHEQNTVHIFYELVRGAGPVRLKLLPTVHNRSHDDPVSTPLPGEYSLRESESRFELCVSDELPALRMVLRGRRQAFTVERQTLPEVLYPIEETRGYEHRGTLWSPGYFRADIWPEESVSLVASSEPWEVVSALSAEDALQAERERRNRRLAAAPEVARTGMAAELVLAADQFVITPVGRSADAVRVHAEGDEVRSVIAGYHWFTDWGRDTMISLEGLALTTGRFGEAGYIIRTFAYFLRDGLLPNLFPEGEREGLYHTADATLWFFYAIDRYLEATRDHATLEILLPRLLDIANHHLQGTKFGIAVDPEDGLLQQGATGYQLTWMDAKVGDWVVTPRRGKAVEINALWYNALRLLADWVGKLHSADAAKWLARAEKVRTSFNRRFWNENAGCLYDVVDGENGNDPAVRPNQIIAFSLKHPVLDEKYWTPVLDVVHKRLLTPVGLRSLSPEHEDYKALYYGDIRARDAAYHQGTVWAWLIGPFVDAWLRVYPDDIAGARYFLDGFEKHLSEACIGSISEIFDAETPFAPRGCIAQAWSVAEVLRCLVKTSPQTPA